MRKSITCTIVIALANLLTGFAAAQSRPPSAESTKLEIVEVVGCLAEEPKGTWFVTNATEPVVSKTPYTNQAAIKAAEAKPLGTLRFGLIAISMFSPDAHRGQKVTVKGLLIKDPKGDQLNVTSLQAASATCQ
jgi:hypothetical protein